MTTFALLTTSLLFGGMVLYAFGFAAFVFSALPTDAARALIRKAFPHFYIFVMVIALLASAVTWSHDVISAVLLAFISLSVIPTRQILMPAINRATDTHATSQFRWLHGASVVITLAHIGVAGVVLARFV